MLQALPHRFRRAAGRWLAPARAGSGKGPGEVELTQRRVFILPTRAGLGYGVMLAVLFIASVNYKLGMGFALTFVLAACALVDMYLTFRNLAWLRLAPGRCPAVFAGDDARFELHLSNRKAHDRYALRIAFMEPDLPERAVDVPARSTCTVLLAAPAPRRGWLAAPRVRLSTRFPLGLLGAWSYWQPDAEVLVYPAPEPDAPPLPLAESGRADRPGQAGQDDFAGIRAYQAGDSPKRLAWRQIARLDAGSAGALVSKHFEGGSGSELLLDFSILPVTLGLESRLSRMTRWVLEAEARAQPYAFRLGDTIYAAGRRRGPPGSLPARPGPIREPLMRIPAWPEVSLSMRPMSRDKADTLLLLGACALALAPHAGHVPWWTALVCTALLFWRGWITFRGNRLPPRWILLPVAALSMGGVYASYQSLLGREAGVAMLVLLLAFKLLEMRAKRDVFVVVFLVLFPGPRRFFLFAIDSRAPC